MKNRNKTKSQLMEELEVLRRRLDEFNGGRPSYTPEMPGIEVSPQSSGLYKALRRLNLNDHLCLIHESPEEWRAAVIPFITVGLEGGEKCIYILGTHTADWIRTCLREEGVDVAGAEASGKLLMLYHSDVQAREGLVDRDRLIALLTAEADRAIDKGYRRIRVTEEIEEHLDSEKLLEYEAKLNRDFFPRFPCVGLCQYDRWKSGPEVIKNAIMTHPLLVRNSQIHRNFYYVPPEEFLSRKRDEREVQDMLASIEQEGETQKRIRFLSNVLELSSQPFSSSYSDGLIMYCNPALSALTGYTEEELRTMTWAVDLTPPEWRELDRETLKELHRTGQPQVYEKEVICKDGSRLPIEVFKHEIHDNGANIQYYYRFVTNITERKRAEEALLKSEMKYRSLAESTGAGIATTDLRGRFTYVNEALCRMIGRSKEELMEKHFIGFLHPDEKKRMLKLFWNSFVHPTGKLQLEFRAVHKKGHVVHMHSNPTIFRYKNGIAGFNAVITDITERKRVEEVLQESEERFRAIFERAKDCIFIKDDTLRYTHVNPAMERVFGLPASEILGLTDEGLFGEEAEAHIREVDACVLSGEAVEEEHTKPVNGTPITFHVIKVPLRDKSGEIIGICGIARDITDRKKTEEALREERDNAILMLQELSS